MGHNPTILGKCRTIFFDLEFYVPEDNRSKTGFCYSPWDENCRILGGSSLVANPETDFGITEEEVRERTKSLWLWDCASEKELLQKIYALLENTNIIVRKAHKGSKSLILCGIGITS